MRVPIGRVRNDGTIDVLGSADHVAKKLRLDLPIFPLLGVGEHNVEGDLPWAVLGDGPQGYLGRRLASWYPGLKLVERPDL